MYLRWWYKKIFQNLKKLWHLVQLHLLLLQGSPSAWKQYLEISRFMFSFICASALIIWISRTWSKERPCFLRWIPFQWDQIHQLQGMYLQGREIAWSHYNSPYVWVYIKSPHLLYCHQCSCGDSPRQQVKSYGVFLCSVTPPLSWPQLEIRQGYQPWWQHMGMNLVALQYWIGKQPGRIPLEWLSGS